MPRHPCNWPDYDDVTAERFRSVQRQLDTEREDVDWPTATQRGYDKR
ncbi:MAG: hypothetical protein JXQ75_12950 [Phycisphaerae bacterium]|nr:hypothetical protein [Phycisphaerae bacterium]